jgi:hypothetical protein
MQDITTVKLIPFITSYISPSFVEVDDTQVGLVMENIFRDMPIGYIAMEEEQIYEGDQLIKAVRRGLEYNIVVDSSPVRISKKEGFPIKHLLTTMEFLQSCKYFCLSPKQIEWLDKMAWQLCNYKIPFIKIK